MPRVWLTEKPSTARALRPRVPAGDRVVAAEGHLLRPAEPEEIDPARWSRWTADSLPILVEELPLKVAQDRGGKSHQPKLDAIAAALDGADELVIATDSGREGSLIGWEIAKHLGWKGRISRLRLEATDEEGLSRALAAWRADPASGERDFANAVEARARQTSDWHLGMTGTRAVSLLLKPAAVPGVWSYGGVQIPTLALLADREAAIADFKPRDFFAVALTVLLESGPELTLWHQGERIFDKEVAEALRERAAAWAGPLKVVKAERRSKPPKLFSLDSLQKVAAKRLGLSPAETEKAAQACYDAGALTYPRTEASFLKASEAGSAAAVLAAVARALPEVAGLVPERPTIRMGHTYRDADAEHFAIVPTRKPFDGGARVRGAAEVYELVARRFLAHHLPDAVDDVTTVTALVPPAGPGPADRFVARGRIERVAGWRAADRAADEREDAPVRKAAEEEDGPGEGTRLPPVADGEGASAREARVETRQTKPPPRITLGELPTVMKRLVDLVDDPALKKALQNPANPDQPKGLGTAATRKDVVERLMKRGYVATLGRRNDPPLQVTAIGMELIRRLRAVYPVDADPVARALLEADLAAIGQAPGRRAAVEAERAFVARIHAKVAELVAALKGAGPLALDPGAVGALPGSGLPGGGAKGPGRPPTKPMVAAVLATARRNRVPPPRGYTKSFDACRAFLDRYPGATQSSPGATQLSPGAPPALGAGGVEGGAPAGPRRASAKQAEWLERLAAEGRLDLKGRAAAELTAEEAGRLLDKAFGKKSGRASAPPNRAARARPPSPPAGEGRGPRRSRGKGEGAGRRNGGAGASAGPA
ncbi:MAG TPA: DNA topoisomerase [Azospirillaceae bacterium]|nr:DNA topoisomerase [Azospirillaceae bacterium]